MMSRKSTEQGRESGASLVGNGVRGPADRGELIDLSHEVEHGMITYPGIPAPIVSDYMSRVESRQHYEEGTEFCIGKIEMVANTGTYIDSPFHRYPDGEDLSQLDLARVADLEGVVVRSAPGERTIGPALFQSQDLEGKAVLVHTGWDHHWGSERYFEGHPFLNAEAAAHLADCGAVLVGIDSLNIDDTSGGGRPAHSILLGADIPVVEHLCNLDKLPDQGFRFFAVPAKVVRFGTFPIRAFAIVAI
jgi:kynurenine formamidase